jgi:ribosomal protein L11 methyltransferase
MAAPGWWRLEIDGAGDLEESLLWKLPELGIVRVAVQHSPHTPDRRQLLAWLPESDWPDGQRRELERALAPLAEPFGVPLPPLRWHRQPEEDWNLSWKRHWQPDPVGERLLILPAWLEVPADQDARLLIRMDPGSAFGTGSHPTTRLCLEAIEQLQTLPGARVADLGCGSGILGIAALLQGARSVAAADTDSLAVRATRDNAAVSGFSQQLQVELGSVERLAELLDGRPADLLLCNILAPVIEALSPAFASVLAPDGLGLLSGLLVDQAPRLQAVLAEQGWRAELTAQQSQWGLMTLRRADVA